METMVSVRAALKEHYALKHGIAMWFWYCLLCEIYYLRFLHFQFSYHQRNFFVFSTNNHQCEINFSQNLAKIQVGLSIRWPLPQNSKRGHDPGPPFLHQWCQLIEFIKRLNRSAGVHVVHDYRYQVMLVDVVSQNKKLIILKKMWVHIWEEIICFIANT